MRIWYCYILLLGVMYRSAIAGHAKDAVHDDKKNENVGRNLELVWSDAQLEGWNRIFESDSSNTHGEPEENLFNPPEMQQLTLEFNESFSLELLQSNSAFCSSGSDDTGLVIWGASVTLGQYLAKANPDLLKGKVVMELGSGSGIPSLLACQLGAQHVIATDFRQATLDHVQYHAKQNNCILDTDLIDWESDKKDLDVEPDVILAADVIYGVSLVPALVRTIKKYLSKDGILVLATRDGRRGIPEFQYLMEQSFVEVSAETHNDTYLPPIPTVFAHDDVSRGRWIGNHSIYTYKWRNSAFENS